MLVLSCLKWCEGSVDAICVMIVIFAVVVVWSACSCGVCLVIGGVTVLGRFRIAGLGYCCYCWCGVLGNCCTCYISITTCYCNNYKPK